MPKKKQKYRDLTRQSPNPKVASSNPAPATRTGDYPQGAETTPATSRALPASEKTPKTPIQVGMTVVSERVLQRWEEEAAAHGWELINKVEKGGYAEYRHLKLTKGGPCGFVRAAKLLDMRMGRVRCGGCQDPSIKWKAIAQAKGWELLNRAGKEGYAEYRHTKKENGDPCGFLQEVSIYQMGKFGVHCGECQDPLVEWRATAQAQGWELVNKRPKGCAPWRQLDFPLNDN